MKVSILRQFGRERVEPPKGAQVLSGVDIATISEFIPKPQSFIHSIRHPHRHRLHKIRAKWTCWGTPLDHVTMLVLNNIKRMYTIDTLDARFISSRQTSVDPTSTSARSRTTTARLSGKEASSSQQAERPLPGTNASRWRSPEYIFYVIAFFSALSWMFKVAFDVSKRMTSVTAAVLCHFETMVD